MTSAPAPISSEALFTVSNVSKSFPGIQALKNVSFSLVRGEIHGLVGGNGAGKSTLIKVMTGALKPDTGTVAMAVASGGDGSLAAIHQELTIVPDMSALSNVFLAAPCTRAGILDRGAMLQQYRAIAARLGARIDPHARGGSLSVADQQLLEIMRALVARHGIIIMDEPTASLGRIERANLFRIVRDLSAAGTAVVFIAHDLDDVLQLCHRVSVMRNGRLIATRDRAAWRKGDLVAAMLDQRLDATSAQEEARPLGGCVLEVQDLQVTKQAPPVSFDLRKGEVLGIAGLVGSGRTELLEALAGARPAAGGRLRVQGHARPMPRSVRAAIANGMVLAPEDRKRSGLVLSQSGAENIILTNMKRVQTSGYVLAAKAIALTNAACRAVGFLPARLKAPAGTLSGGNQQKLVIGKWLPVKPAVLMLDEPTRGVDVGGKAEMFRTLHALCAGGMSTIVVSSEFEELIDHCDRILVLAGGRILGTLSRPFAGQKPILDLIFAPSNEQAA